MAFHHSGPISFYNFALYLPVNFLKDVGQSEFYAHNTNKPKPAPDVQQPTRDALKWEWIDFANTQSGYIYNRKIEFNKEIF